MTAFLLAMLAAAAAPAPAEQAAIFNAAGFTRHGSAWKSGNCDGMESESYEPGKIDTYRDLNGDGRPDAVVTEGGAICYGNTGTHFWLLSKAAGGSWTVMMSDTGVPGFLAVKGAGGWPDVELGGPGFCFPVYRWNGRAYAVNRSQYEGKRCTSR
ncbi:MAG: hypothetical protein ABI626_01650 [Sphingomicrobium sp.]